MSSATRKPRLIISAANRAKELREESLSKMTSMAFETVFSTAEKLDFVIRAKATGFFVRLFFICTLPGQKQYSRR